MPNINRIRVNNVKYNFGTQQYDDFTMRLYGKNTLYDLANGGGKSVLMLLLLQNLIPNCTLDEKQPIEKLFRNGGGNTVIHSLVEWKLDEDDVEEGYRYMTTGFCARKAKDSADGVEVNKDTAAIEYFNYCIFYRDYNANDIINLPLQKDNERITFTGLKTYLKELARKDLSLSVQVFDRKGEYQRFISRYGLYESQWEIIRGINKTEGHVRAYFENHYKTTRKVVEDLLIEEIIEKAFLVKTAQSNETDDMAKNLLDIKDKLSELAGKKRDIANFDRQIELLNVLQARVNSFLGLYKERDDLSDSIADVYVTGEAFLKENEKQIARYKIQKEEKRQEKNSKKRELETFKIKESQFELEKQQQALLELCELSEKLKAERGALEEELKHKESVNDYLEYLKDVQAKKENEEMIQAAVHKGSGELTELYTLAYNKKQRDAQKKSLYEKELGEAEKALLEASEKEAYYSTLLKEGTIALEVAKTNERRGAESYHGIMEQISALRKNLQLLTLGDIPDMIEKNENLQRIAKSDMENARQDLENSTQGYYQAKFQVSQLKKEVAQKEKAYEAYLETVESETENQEKIKKMLKIYGVVKVEELFSAINDRYIQCIVDVTNKRQELKELHKRKNQLLEKRMLLETPAVKKVKEYIETRHGEMAVMGADYIAAQPDDKKEALLERFPLLPYGVIAKNFEALTTDIKIKELNLGDYAVPVFDEAVLNLPVVREEDSHVMFIHKTKAHFIDETLIKEEQNQCQEQIKQLEESIRILAEMGLTYEEDMDFISKLSDNQRKNAAEEMRILKQALDEEQAELKKQQDLEHDLALAIEKYQKAVDQSREDIFAHAEDGKLLAELKQLSRQAEALEETKLACGEEKKRLTGKLTELLTEHANWEAAKNQAQSKIEARKQAISQMEQEWETLYKDYDKPGDYNILDIEDGQLEARFKACRAVVENENMVLGDKRKLIEALDTGMKRTLKGIQKRGIDIKMLEQEHKENALFPVSEEALAKLSKQLSVFITNEAQLQNEIDTKKSGVSKAEGSIEQAIHTLEAQFGAYEEPDVTREEAIQAIKEGDSLLKALDEAYTKLELEYDKQVKEQSVMSELYKDAKRIVEGSDISLERAKIVHGEKEQLRETFEKSLLAFDKSNKALERAKGELVKYKSHTAQTLYSMQAFELSDTIGKDVEVPKDYGEAKALLDSLNSIVEYIGLEKGRVEKGIADMEFIKNNFENQCIQRCHDVKTELEKLPKLSRIILEGEPIQMVGLTIPYVKEEFIKQRMSDYIDDVVKKADGYEDQNARMKYIRNRLALKNLFSVIVTDMNGIKLSLYKRERMKEQSRYLRYEEAVGSTGQSQGIYIQFLVAVINYISGIYAPNAENNKLKKVIFIDNPFGAAKDVYIWEPIFAMLKTNHVQLIVPARGATPAITARFDVNYILGQQLVGGRQQTVVIDYRSQVEQEEVEYQRLEYEQASFDFI